jgi:hypothetical protein
MNDFLDSLICRQTFDTQALMNSHPPKFYHANKKLVYDICCPPGCTHGGQLAFSPMVRNATSRISFPS